MAVWMALTAPVRKLVSDAIAEAREQEARREIADPLPALTWTKKDDQAFDQAFGEYLQGPE
jgi:hypothetical protein